MDFICSRICLVIPGWWPVFHDILRSTTLALCEQILSGCYGYIYCRWNCLVRNGLLPHCRPSTSIIIPSRLTSTNFKESFFKKISPLFLVREREREIVDFLYFLIPLADNWNNHGIEFIQLSSSRREKNATNKHFC